MARETQDALQYLPLKKWGELQKVFKEDWPRGMAGFVVLETQKHFFSQGLDYGFTVYCPFGDVLNGMVAINEKNEFYEIIIQCPRDDTEKLEDALRRTKVIDWERSIIVPFVPYHVIDCLQRALKDIVNVRILPSQKFIMDKPFIYDDVSLPPNITFGLLSPEHLDLVDSTWPHRYPTSPWYFELLFKTKTGYGLFEDNALISWVFFTESGTLLHLYTIETHRKKGYAEILLKLLCNILVKEQKPVLVYCLKDNYNAIKLYTKMGLAKAEPAAWCYLNKIEK